MKTVKNYDQFSENYRLNEGLLGKAWGAIVNFFKKKFGVSYWLYYALFLKKNGELPKEKVEIIVPSNYGVNYKDLPDKEEIELSTESLKNSNISISMLNEDFISLQHPDVNMRNVDVDELVDKITTIFMMNEKRVEQGKPRKKNHALFIWGAPGIGKTEILNQVAEKVGAVVLEWHLSQIEPTDFRGMPKIENILKSDNPNDERTVTKLPALFPSEDETKPGIMFFDEMNRAPKMVLSAALSLCLSGKIGNYKLPDRWIVIAAGNRPEDLGGGVATPIEPALANRFAHVNYAPTLGAWMKWAITKEFINPDLIGFLQFNNQYFHRLDPDKDQQNNWPSPRTWEEASTEEYFERNEDWSKRISNDKIKNIYTDWVGLDTALAFIEYLKLREFYNEKDVEDVYKKGAKAKQPPKRLDQANAAYAAIAYFKKAQKLSVEELTNVLEFAINLPEQENITTLLSKFGFAHPEIKTDDPYKDIWWSYVKKWHIKLQEIS